MSNKRDAIRSFLKLEPAATDVPLVIETSTEEEGYRRSLVTYSDRHGHPIPAYLFEPTESATGNGVVALHQHNSRWDIGKSEVAGLDGDPLQAFGPALARRGISVLAPDAIGFESRRDTAPEIPDVAPPIENPRNSIENWLQYYNHAMHRIVQGELLIRDVLDDVARAVTVLQSRKTIDRTGLIGHSYGGTAALFAAALDERSDYACVSGALCSYARKFSDGIPLDMALVIPGFAAEFDVDDLVDSITPRPLFVVSADADRYSADAEAVIEKSHASFQERGCAENLRHLHVTGGHPLDHERFEAIIAWGAER